MTTYPAPYFDGTQPCAHRPGDMWFATEDPKDRGALRTALRLCGECPFRVPCAQYAVDTDQRYGIWGGTTERKREAARLKGRPVAVGRPAPTHGKLSTYTKHLCRCDLCRGAWDAYLLRQREQRRATTKAVRAIGEHGYNAYSYGCRCDTCRSAKAEYSRDARQRKAS